MCQFSSLLVGSNLLSNSRAEVGSWSVSSLLWLKSHCVMWCRIDYWFHGLCWKHWTCAGKSFGSSILQNLLHMAPVDTTHCYFLRTCLHLKWSDHHVGYTKKTTTWWHSLEFANSDHCQTTLWRQSSIWQKVPTLDCGWYDIWQLLILPLVHTYTPICFINL